MNRHDTVNGLLVTIGVLTAVEMHFPELSHIKECVEACTSAINIIEPKKQCKYCGRRIENEWTCCPYCGRGIPYENT